MNQNPLGSMKKGFEDINMYYNNQYFDFQQNQIGSILGQESNPLDQIKEKAEEQSNHGHGGQQISEGQPKQKPTNSKNTYIKKINNLVKTSYDNLQALDNKQDFNASQQDNSKMLRKTKSSYGLDLLNNQHQTQQQQQQSQQMQGYSDPSMIQQQQQSLQNQNANPAKENQKLVRNRESARNSRKRKKIYLELLENKVTQLNDILQDSKRICCASEQLLNNLQTQIQYKNDQQTNKTILLNNLQNSLNSNASENDVGIIIEGLKRKFGSNNPERMMVLDYCFKQIAEQMLPVHMKYILYVASESKDIYSPDQDKDDELENQNKTQEFEFPKIIQSLKLSESQKKKAIKMQKKLSKEKEKLEQLVNNMYETKEKMKKELNSLDETMENLIKDFKPSQISKFLLSIERTQYNNHMKQAFQKFFEGDNDDSDDDSDNDLQSFIQNQDSCNTLMVDVNEAYDVYTDAYEFLQKKRHLSTDVNQTNLNAAAQAAFQNDSN
ncbi:basic region leucine zipper protein (macronuclear) [Tetrahymena thermophila SB210]|uniref:Basic region leucine zipper protein n=1 Tax=Tetrahymena thermophila (strain SB210) TaxID=312017 RepID=I7ME28_TETTS|nr:basic region leucine zipper protein [Tetrahymena thermophila SB210]EAR94136.3 basic region leucine zipper protein [Tetrahymena thermophila SB210]|eukprot:XP_001014381.3 basic region leucine zipper protein [Tetrahymena thermophila SB210]